MRKMFLAIDRWLCVKLRPIKLRAWWCELWIRADEFHPSLNLDVEVAVRLPSDKERMNYTSRLLERRDIAHKRTL